MDEQVHFSRETFRFLSDLAENNDRDWFNANRDRYEAHVERPMLDFIRDFEPALRQINPRFAAVPRIRGGSMFRIHRDMRFTKDDRPYKTWAAAQFAHRGDSQDVHGPGFYLHLEPGDSFMGGGIWHPDTDTLTRIRDKIVERPGRWLEVIGADEFDDSFELVGDRLKLGPRGYPRDHPQIEHLKWKDFTCRADFTEAQVRRSDFLDAYAEACRKATDFMHFLTEAVGLEW